jgi:hypothetical protein
MSIPTEIRCAELIRKLMRRVCQLPVTTSFLLRVTIAILAIATLIISRTVQPAALNVAGAAVGPGSPVARSVRAPACAAAT